MSGCCNSVNPQCKSRS